MGASSIEKVMLGGLSGSVAAGAVLSKLIYQRLKSRHPDTFARLGSPGLFLRIPVEARRGVARFIWGNESRLMDDAKITLLVGALRVVTIAAIALFVLLVVKILFNVPG